ncbi:hypothetical protein FOZ76_21315 [Verticiella sediminum]|uniref:Uncharacterized protein n=2 Tax=Verticiella sediminum TaxID=1247510 RepID=A0A556AD04_9BURK|nr:hypothetical protein FOZ76_21315 [Verticiella sediminum]
MGELFIWTDIDPAHEQDFNLWYDREHMAERARIPGFAWARRYHTRNGERPYLALYRTESLHTFGTEAYQQAFQHQTPWSIQNFARMRNTNRRVMVVTLVAGVGTGGALGMVPLGGTATAEKAFAIANTVMSIEGVLALRVLTPEPSLSTPLPSEPAEGRKLEPMLLVDATNEPAAAAAARAVAAELNLPAAQTHTFNLLWDLRSADLAT